MFFGHVNFGVLVKGNFMQWDKTICQEQETFTNYSACVSYI